MGFLKLGLKLTQSAKRIQQTVNPQFLGDVDIKKWSPFFFGVLSAIFWHLKTGTFGKSAQNGTSVAKQKNGDHF